MSWLRKPGYKAVEISDADWEAAQAIKDHVDAGAGSYQETLGDQAQGVYYERNVAGQGLSVAVKAALASLFNRES